MNITDCIQHKTSGTFSLECMLGERDVKTEEAQLEKYGFEYMAEVAFIHRLLSPFYKIYQHFFNEATMTYSEKNWNRERARKVSDE